LQVLNSKLCTNSDAGRQWTGVQSVILYEGSITNFGSQLQGFDIGTCLEVNFIIRCLFCSAIVNFVLTWLSSC